jgi:hypothetical protein
MGLVFLQGCEVYHISKHLDAGHIACHKHFLYPEKFLPAGVLLSFLVLTCHNKKDKAIYVTDRGGP